MKRKMIGYPVLLLCLFVLGGCFRPVPSLQEQERIPDPVMVFRSFGSYYLLSCLNDSQDMDREEFAAGFEAAEAALESGTDLDTLRYVCLSLSPQSDYREFQKGVTAYERYLGEHPQAGSDMEGLRILVRRLDEELGNRWGAWKTLLREKNELQERVDALQNSLDQAEIRNMELQKQIEQLKNIENIIKSRGTDRP